MSVTLVEEGLSDFLANQNNFRQQSLGFAVQSFGLELESFMVNPNAMPKGPILPWRTNNLEVLARANDSRFAPELSAFAIEGRTSPVFRSKKSRGDIFCVYTRKAFEMWNAKKELFGSNGAIPLSVGNLPFDREFLARFKTDWSCKDQRYQNIIETLNLPKHTELPYEVRFPRLRQTTSQFIPVGGAVSALASQHSLNIGFLNEYAGQAANILTALTPVAAIFSNSACAGNGVGKYHWNRLSYLMNGMGSQNKFVKFSVGKYYDARDTQAFLEFVDHCMSRENLVPYDNEGLKKVGGIRWPMIKNQVGQSWMVGPRFSWQDDETGKLSIWSEFRALDAQPTLSDGFAIDLLLMGFVSYCFHESINDISLAMPFEMIEKTTQRIAKFGPYHKDSRVLWFGKEVQAVNWVCDHLIPCALKGIEMDLICDDFLAIKYLEILKRTLSKKLTGVDWVKERVSKSYQRRGESEALSMSLIDLAITQSEAQNNLTFPLGFVDIVSN